MPVSHSHTLLCEWPRNSGLNNDALTPFCFLLWGKWVQCLEEQQPASLTKISYCCCSLMSDCLQFHGLQHTWLLFAPLSPALCSNSYPLNQWCCLIISSSAARFSSCLQSFPASGFFSDESVLCLRWPKYWCFSFSISPSNEYSGLISFRIDWFYLLVVQLILKNLLQHNSKASVLQYSAFFYGPPLTSVHDYWQNHSSDYTDLGWQNDVSAF